MQFEGDATGNQGLEVKQLREENEKLRSLVQVFISEKRSYEEAKEERRQKEIGVEQVAWVFSKLLPLFSGNPVSFRKLIYDRMGFGPDAYCKLYDAGGMEITNAACDLDDYREKYGRGDSEF